MKKSKKGSSLVMVLVIFMVLTVLGVSLSSLALANYRMRVLNSNIKTNLYASEAGIDEVYAIIGNNIDKAIGDGNSAVENFMNTLDLEQEIENVNDGGSSAYVNSDLTINEEAIKREQNRLFRSAYVSSIIGSDFSNVHLIATLNNLRNDSNFFKPIGDNPPSIDARVLGNVETIDYSSENTDKLLTMRITSTFKHKNLEKTLNADYDIYVPKYEDNYYLETNYLKIPKNPVWTKAIASDGNLKLKSQGLNVNGDIFAKGNSEDTTTSSYGIEVDASDANINFKGKVSTLSDFTVASKSNLNITGDVFTNNFFLNKTARGANVIFKKDITASSGNQGGSLYTLDDLQINAPYSNTEIQGGFYGLEDGNNSKYANQSSSININIDEIGSDGYLACNLKVLDESIIMGSSYVNAIKLGTTDERYQTGESVSIKGNYKAYTYPLRNLPIDNKLNGDNVIFDPYKPIIPNSTVDFPPLKFASRYLEDNNGSITEKLMNIFDKSEYLKYYNDEYGLENRLLWKGININLAAGKSIRVGAGITQSGDVLIGNYTNDNIDTVTEKTEELKKMMYKMGEATALGTKETPITVSKQLNFSAIPEGINKYEFDEGVIVLINGTGEYSITQGSATSVSGNNIVIGKDKVIIISRGDLKLQGNFNFNGTIISQGNINIIDGSSQNISYDKKVVKDLIGMKYDLFGTVFLNSLPEFENVQLNPSIRLDNASTSIRRDKLIKIKNWTIVK